MEKYTAEGIFPPFLPLQAFIFRFLKHKYALKVYTVFVPSKVKDLITALLVQNHIRPLALTFVSVINNPLIEVTMIIPTRIKEMC